MKVHERGTYVLFELALSPELNQLRDLHQPRAGEPLTEQRVPDRSQWLPAGFTELLSPDETDVGLCFVPSPTASWITLDPRHPPHFLLAGVAAYLDSTGAVRGVPVQVRVMTRKVIVKVLVSDLFRMAIDAGNIFYRLPELVPA